METNFSSRSLSANPDTPMLLVSFAKISKKELEEAKAGAPWMAISCVNITAPCFASMYWETVIEFIDWKLTQLVGVKSVVFKRELRTDLDINTSWLRGLPSGAHPRFDANLTQAQLVAVVDCGIPEALFAFYVTPVPFA